MHIALYSHMPITQIMHSLKDQGAPADCTHKYFENPDKYISVNLCYETLQKIKLVFVIGNAILHQKCRYAAYASLWFIISADVLDGRTMSFKRCMDRRLHKCRSTLPFPTSSFNFCR